MYLEYTRICKHWRVPVKVGQYTIKCSAYLDAPAWANSRNRIQFNGILLDYIWINIVKPYNVEFVDWPDMHVVSVGYLDSLVDSSIKLLEKGAVLNIGCIGGHGRTGTLLAALIMKIENLQAGAAIIEARKRYCELAIETNAQEKLLYRYYCLLHNIELPKTLECEEVGLAYEDGNNILDPNDDEEAEYSWIKPHDRKAARWLA
jgi:hypothetical protein